MLVSDVPQLRHTESITVLTFVITAFRDEKMYHGKQFCYLADGAENNLLSEEGSINKLICTQDLALSKL